MTEEVNHYIGERESDFTCYAVFYRAGTEEEICRIKYFDSYIIKYYM